MVLTHQQRIERLRERQSELAFWTNRKAIDLDQWHFQGKPLALRCPWPTRDGVVDITHPWVAVPDDWPLEHTRLELDLGGECLLRLHYGDSTSDTYGLDPNHRRFPLGRRGFTVHAEGAARLPFGAPHPDPRIAYARLCWIEPDLEALIRRLTLVAQAAEALGENEVVAPLLACAEAAFYGLDWPSATGAYLARVAASGRQRQIWTPPLDLEPAPEGLGDRHIASVRAATEQLKSCLRSLRRRYAPQGAVALTGHAHLDLAWLWPMAETRHKATRSFHTIINLMDRYPDFRFNQSSAALYDFVEQDDPALFARIKDKTAGGQWETIGGMWVEPDTNMPTGESLVRQLLYGQRYFERKFGERHTVCWLPDSFGFSPALPQILRLAGIDSFCTTKMNWSETNKMPYDLFWWEGLDGSRVLAHSFDNPAGGYNADLGSSAVIHTWRNFRGKHHYPESLLSFGYGDGGGGPTEEMIERQRALADFPAVPTLRSTKVSTFFRDVHDSASTERLPVWLGEMYLELHRGTLTSQGGIK